MTSRCCPSHALGIARVTALVTALGTVGAVSAAWGAVLPHPLFAEHAVLQQGIPVPVWGSADPGEIVSVAIAGQKVSTTTGADGKWLVRLAPIKAGGPYTLTIAGKNQVVLDDILVGEVWVCSGQSNMERQLGLRPGQQPITDWEKEVAAAKHPLIRHFGVEQTKALTPLATVKGRWDVCTPDAVKDFTAVGYFFGRDLQAARKVPIGLIHSSWGGTPAEAWTSAAGLRALPDFAAASQDLELVRSDPRRAQHKYETDLEGWFAANDAGSAPGKSWSAPALDVGAWKAMVLPTLWENAGEPDLNGVVWFRKTFDLPAGAATAPAELQLGMVDDIDSTFVNGSKVGFTTRYNIVRKYALPAGLLKPGRNVIAVRVLDTGGGGGIWGDEKLQVVFKGDAARPSVDLSGVWQYRIGMNLHDGPWPPISFNGDVDTPTVLYNGMIAPLLPYAIRGVVWYQGESNVRRERQYRTLFPALIADWRRAWDQGDFPFLFVQIAPYREMTPEIREAQLLSWQRTPNTAMVVTSDCGDANDIHPAHKQPVGARLALAARALAYGERLEYSGPVFASMTVKGGKAILRFSHVGGGLLAKGGALTGFTMAGADGIFHPARAHLRGATVVVASDGVDQPRAVRYGWASVPQGNLFNQAGLPASPFRTDTD
jgi:sialate O-acetylesterase